MFYVHTCKSVYCPQSWCDIPQRVTQITVPKHTHTYTHRHKGEMHIFTQTVLLQYCIFLYVWYCGVHVLSCYEAVWGGRGSFGLLGWSQVKRHLLFLSLFYLLVFLRSDSLLQFSSGLKLPRGGGKTSFLGTDHKHIPGYSLCCHLNPDAFLLRWYMCPVLANSHVYKVHICVHTCNTQAIYYCD